MNSTDLWELSQHPDAYLHRDTTGNNPLSPFSCSMNEFNFLSELLEKESMDILGWFGDVLTEDEYRMVLQFVHLACEGEGK